MKIILNNREEYFEGEKVSITELLSIKKFTFKMLVIKINGEIVRKNEYGSKTIADGDDVMVLHLVSGG
jgi:thiamine biosynthesis protein ThiS